MQATAEKKRSLRLTGKALVITQEDASGRQVDAYFLSEDAASQPAHRIFRLGKSDCTTYRVVITEDERFEECTCKGHKFYRKCKHRSALRKLIALGRL